MLSSVVALVGCDFPGKPDPADRPRTPSQITGFEVLFGANCAGCHGADGDLGPAPPLNDSLFLHIVSTEQLSQVIHNGRHGTPMPAFARAKGGTLTDQQIKILADGLPKHWKTDENLPDDLPKYEVASARATSPPPATSIEGRKSSPAPAPRVTVATAKEAMPAPSTIPSSWQSSATRRCGASSLPAGPISACQATTRTSAVRRTSNHLLRTRSTTWWRCWQAGESTPLWRRRPNPTDRSSAIESLPV